MHVQSQVWVHVRMRCTYMRMRCTCGVRRAVRVYQPCTSRRTLASSGLERVPSEEASACASERYCGAVAAALASDGESADSKLSVFAGDRRMRGRIGGGGGGGGGAAAAAATGVRAAKSKKFRAWGGRQRIFKF